MKIHKNRCPQKKEKRSNTSVKRGETARAVTLSSGPRYKHLLWGRHFFLYLIFNSATFLNTGIISDSALQKDFSIKIMRQNSIELNK